MPRISHRAVTKRGRTLTSRARADRHGDRRADPATRVDQVSRAYEELRNLIVWGQLAPGTRIAERTVADRLGLSRTPVRSALHRLQQEGLIESVSRGRDQRLVIAPLTHDDAREVFTLIGHLEGVAARLAAQRPAPERRALAQRLRKVNHELSVASRNRHDANRMFHLDLEFHTTFVEGVGGRRLVALHRGIRAQGERYSRLYLSVLLDEIGTSAREHEAIAAAIAKGDVDGAQHAAEMNWENAADRLTRVIAEHGERGVWHAWG